MTITLPLDPVTWPIFRVLHRPVWGVNSATGESGGDWAELMMQRPDPESSGMILESYSRALLPQLGQAKLLFRYGIFGGKIIGGSADQNYNQKQGQQWSAAAELGGVPSLAGKEILIQTARAYTPGSAEAKADPVWQLVWWGTCEYQTDEGWGAALIPSGQRTYHCVEALHRLKRWPLQSHGFSGGTLQMAKARGNPGYNVSAESSSVQGNRALGAETWVTESEATALYHSLPGAGTTWTDLQVINHLLAVARPPGEPLWTLTGATDLFGGTSSWPVEDGDTAWDLLTRIVDRGRGRGAVRCEYTQASPLGPVVPFLKVYAQINEDITFNEPAGTSVTIKGASNVANATAVDVDVIGDHRFVESSLLLGDAEQYQVGYLETQGEQIEVMATLAYIDATLDIGWKPAQEAAFRALEPHNRKGPKWVDVLQLFRLPRNFSCLGGTGNGGGLERFDYRCSDTGAVSVGTVFDTSPANVTLLDDLPIFLGYDYTTSPIRTDGDSSSVFAGDPARMPVAFYVRTGDNLYKEWKETGEGSQPKVYPDGFLIETTSADNGYRYFWHETKGNTGGQYQASALVITCALRLPHRVRMATGDPTSKRRKIIRHGGLHLWMADQSAIWSLDTSAVSAGADAPAKRAAATAVGGILRDDRNALSRLHAMSVAWYGPLEKLTGQSEPDAARRSCSWSLRCCGDIASAADYDGGGVIYPDVGKLVKYISANGQRIRLMTPVSSFIYDNTNGVTTWTTDWQDLDFARV